MIRYLAIAVLLVSSAHAADFNKIIVSDEGKPFCAIEPKDDSCPKGQELTVGRAARNALYATLPEERDISGDEKYHRAELASKLAGTVELKAEDAALVKKLVARVYGPLVVMRVWDEVDPKKK